MSHTIRSWKNPYAYIQECKDLFVRMKPFSKYSSALIGWETFVIL
jgi:hypothetical protein